MRPWNARGRRSREASDRTQVVWPRTRRCARIAVEVLVHEGSEPTLVLVKHWALEFER